MEKEREVTYKIVEQLVVLGTNSKTGWTKEFNFVSWNGKDPKYDIREWDPKHEKMSKGVTLTVDEMQSIFACFSAKTAKDITREEFKKLCEIDDKNIACEAESGDEFLAETSEEDN